jgi:tripartite-type tricarboxylate transporter receptor subunit TctC
MMTKLRDRARRALLAAGLLCATAAAAGAADFPDKPIRLVIPYPPGGASSLHGGVIATSAEPYFGQPMIPLIRHGGGGIAGASYVLQQPADGYTLLFGDVTVNLLRPLVEKDIPFKIGDFEPIGRITLDPMVFVASPKAPFKTMREMVAFATKNPDKLVYSSDNVNGWTYVAFKALMHKTGTKMRGIDFGGGGPAVANILGGNTMAYAGAPAVVGEHVKGGALIALCTAGKERALTLPDVPTCTETGYDVMWQVWLGVLAKKGTPEPVLAKLREGFGKLVADKGLKALIARITSEIKYVGAEDWKKELEEEKKSLMAIYALTQ